jgi:hypothetical protein
MVRTDVSNVVREMDVVFVLFSTTLVLTMCCHPELDSGSKH